MDFKKMLTAMIFILLGIILVSVFWRNALLLSFVLILVALMKHYLLPIKKELTWYAISGVVGSLTESVIMLSGPWSYTQSLFVNFPLWLVFLWGYAGTLGISFYEGLTNKH